MALYLPLSWAGHGAGGAAAARNADDACSGRISLALPVGFLWHGDILDETYVLRAEDVRTFD